MTLFARGSRETGGKPFVSLRIKFAAVLLMTAVATVITALLTIPVALNLITEYHMKPERVDARLDDYIHNFAEYVAEDQVRSDDTSAVVKWTKFHRYVHLVVFEGNEAQFGVADGEILEGDASPAVDPIFTGIISEDEDPNATIIGNTYVVRFADRICSVSVIDYSRAAVADVVLMGGIILSTSVFLVVMLLYYHSQTRAIVALSRDVERVSGGELSADISSQRNDEIGGLARDVNAMRTTIIQKMDEQQDAWRANGELITSMSHDIRTPLTALLGYMELLQNDQDNLTEEQKAYIRVCAGKAEQIKGLSDKLFLYFWAYNRRENEVETEPYEAGLLLDQMLGEALIWLESEGMTVKLLTDPLPPEVRVTVNIDCLRRVVDNIFDNIRKYADLNHPIELSITSTDEEVLVSVGNTVSTKQRNDSSTGIGLKTCRNMMSLMGGGLSTEQGDGRFKVVLRLPVKAL